ncbi:FeoA family protein [Devriesea agamarum]|uniref:FeoA family protein n=1 Tax=Devriesea agamarum TaxID=472569 RepID=UPI00071E021A|nr:FeoA family protein [Devriesea agamarum]
MSATTLLDVHFDELVTLGHPQVDAGFRRRLAELGLRTGVSVRAIQRTPGGGRLIGIGSSRVALDRRTCAALRIAGKG